MKISSAKIHLVPSKLPVYPLIEIIGQIDCGKRAVADLVGKKLNAKVINFPVFKLGISATGTALMDAILNNPDDLIKESLWWALLSAANMQESKSYVEDYLARGPVIVTNYIRSSALWFKCLDHVKRLGYFAKLKPADFLVKVTGPEWNTPGNLPIKLPLYFRGSYNQSIRLITNANLSISLTPEEERDKFRHIAINKAAFKITKAIITKFPHLKVYKTGNYSLSDFLLKKDEH